MISTLSELITAGQLGSWLVIAILVAYFIYKEWPDFKQRITSGALKEQKEEQEDRTVSQRLDSIEENLKEINEKLDSDYERINAIEQTQKKHKKILDESLEEREIIMEGLLGALGGLQQLGANGKTTEAASRIKDYLNKKAHAIEEEG